MREQELLKAKEKQEIVSSPKSKEAKTETFQTYLNDSMTVKTHLASAKSVENVSGTKLDNTNQEVASKKIKEFSDENQNKGHLTPLLIKAAAKEVSTSDTGTESLQC